MSHPSDRFATLCRTTVWPPKRFSGENFFVPVKNKIPGGKKKSGGEKKIGGKKKTGEKKNSGETKNSGGKKMGCRISAKDVASQTLNATLGRKAQKLDSSLPKLPPESQ
jgi:hypothetical protein